jgi:nitrate/nitrite-specific signal transduction histidine kinase
MFLWIGWGSLRTKIIAWSFIPTVIILTAVGLVAYQAYERVVGELVLGRDRELAFLSSAQLKDSLVGYSDALVSLARTPEIRNNDASVQQTGLWEASQRLAYFDGGMLTLDTFGKVVAAEPDRPEILGQDWSNRDYFRQILYSRKPAFSDIVQDGPEQAAVVVFAVPISGDRDEFLGVLAGMFRLDTPTLSPFYGSIAKLRLGEAGRAYLVDGNGRVIYHSDESFVGQDFSGQPNVQQVLSGNVGAVRTTDLEGLDIVAAYAPVPGTSWGFVTEDNWAMLSASDQKYGRFLLLLLGFGIVIPALFVFAGVRRIIRPIRELNTAAQQVAEGNFGLTIDATTGDEIENLAKQFNRMSAELKESYANLEQKIANRTRELAALYDVTAAASSSLDLDIVLDRSLEHVLKAMGAKVGAIHLLDEQRGVLNLAASRGVPRDQIDPAVSVPLDLGLAGWVIEHGELLFIPNLAEAQRPLLVVPAGVDQAYIGVPIEARGRKLGVLSLVGDKGRQFSADEVALLASIADEVSLAIENARLHEQAEQLAVMEERNRLARELHDSVTQLLYSLTLFAEAGQRMVRARDFDRTEQYLHKLGETAQQAHREMRLLIYELRSPVLENEGLVNALQHRLDTVEKRAGLDACLQVSGNVHLQALIEDGLFRIALEALNNALKHAKATTINVCLQEEDHQVTLKVIDDGKGFDLETANNGGGLGLRGMRERAEYMGGSLEILSKPGEGTCIAVKLDSRVSVPYEEREKGQ